MKEFNSVRKGLFVAFALVAMFVSNAVAQEQDIKAAVKLLNRGQNTKALEAINKAAQASPDNARVLYYQGMVQAKTGDKKAAEMSFQKGIEKDPKNALNLAGKGYLRMLDNNAAEAKQLFDQALTLSKSKNGEVLRAVAEGYLLSDRTAGEAVNNATKAKAANDMDAQTHIVLGDALMKVSPPRGGEAVSAYEKAAKLDPTDGIGFYKAGMVYFRSRNNAVAEENLIKATTADPTFAPAYKELGELYYQTKQSAKAVTAWENYMKNIENPESAESNYAFYLFMDKQYDKANAIFTKLLAKPDVSLTTYKYAFYAAVEAKKFDDAHTLFGKYKAKAGVDNISAGDWNYHGKMLMENGQDSIAVRSFARAYAKDTAQVEILAKVADIYFKSKKYDSASIAYKELIAKSKKPNPNYFYNLGRAQYVAQDYVNADSTFQKLAEIQPNSTVPYLWLGRTNAAIEGEKDMKKGVAKKYFEMLIEKGLNNEKSKKDVIDAYHYLSSYEIQVNGNMNAAEAILDKILALDPNDQRAKDGKAAIKQARIDQKKAQQAQQQK
jgi:tetratricopeptide (TPR) repeat protein